MTSDGPPSRERRFQALVENSREILVVLGRGGSVEYVSPSLERIMGFHSGDKVGTDPLEQVHPDDLGRVSRELGRLLEEPGATWSGRIRAIHKDGSLVVLDVSAESLLEDPDVRGVVVNVWDVTELVRTEEELRRREELLSSVVANVPMVVFALDTEGRFVLCEGLGLRSVGLRPGEVVGVSALTIYRDHPEIVSDVRSAMQGESFRTLRSWAGRVFQTWWSPLGEGGGSLGVMLDVTERHEAEARQRRLLTLIDQTPDFVGIATVDGMLQHVNPAGRDLVGLRPDEDLRGRHLSIFHPPRIMRLMEEEAFPTAATEGSWTGESALVDADGNEIPVRQVVVGHRGPDDEVAYFSTVASDLRERMRSMERIRFQSELLDAVGQAVVGTDTEARIIYWNQAAEELYGWTAEEAMGRNIGELVAAPAAREQAEEIIEGLQSGRGWSGEIVMRRKDGSEFPGLTNTAPLRGEAGGLVGMVGVTTDLTRQKGLEAELREAQKMEAIGRLAGGIAHDFNNLLTTIQGHVDLLRRDLDAESELQADLAEVQDAAGRAAGLTRQLLAFSRRQMFQERVLDLVEEVEGMRAMLRRLTPASVEFEVELLDEVVRVRADPSQIHQVLLNLVINAIDAMPDGGSVGVAVGVEDEVRLSDAGGEEPWVGPCAHLRVEDDGPGMSAEVLDRIFEPFFTTKDVGKGTGLGLSTVFGIVKQSGGDIEVESRPGEGTVFHVFFPLVDDEVDPPDSTRSGAEPLELHGGAGTILVVEDDDSVRSFTTRVLRRAGYRVLEAPNGGAALRTAGSHRDPIHLVLSDVVMPAMGGVELAERLRTDHPGLRVVLTSGYAREELPRGPEELGVPFLPKPFGAGELLEVVRGVLEGD